MNFVLPNITIDNSGILAKIKRTLQASSLKVGREQAYSSHYY